MLSELKSVLGLLNGLNPKKLGINQLRLNKLSNSNFEKEFWLRSVEKVIRILNDLRIDYVVINYLDIPYTYMRDLDLLVENKEDREELLLALKKNGYGVCRYSFLPFSDNKITYFDPETKLEIDVYPKLAWSWWKITYAPPQTITSNKVKKRLISENVYVPSPTYDLYITAVHTHVHSKITLSEIAHFTKLILNHSNNINWQDLLLLARFHGIEHTLYAYLFLIQIILTYLKKCIPNVRNLLSELHSQYSSSLLINLFIKMLLKNNSNFPLKYPYLIRFLSFPREQMLKLQQFHIKKSIQNVNHQRVIVNE